MGLGPEVSENIELAPERHASGVDSLFLVPLAELSEFRNQWRAELGAGQRANVDLQTMLPVTTPVLLQGHSPMTTNEFMTGGFPSSQVATESQATG